MKEDQSRGVGEGIFPPPLAFCEYWPAHHISRNGSALESTNIAGNSRSTRNPLTSSRKTSQNQMSLQDDPNKKVKSWKKDPEKVAERILNPTVGSGIIETDVGDVVELQLTKHFQQMYQRTLTKRSQRSKNSKSSK